MSLSPDLQSGLRPLKRRHRFLTAYTFLSQQSRLASHWLAGTTVSFYCKSNSVLLLKHRRNGAAKRRMTCGASWGWGQRGGAQACARSSSKINALGVDLTSGLPAALFKVAAAHSVPEQDSGSGSLGGGGRRSPVERSGSESALRGPPTSKQTTQKPNSLPLETEVVFICW